MNKKTKLIGVLCIMIFFTGLVGSYVVLQPSDTKMVQILQDNQVLQEFNLTAMENQEIEIDYHGKKNVVVIEDGEVFVSHADCPDHDCVKMGTLNSSNLPIVCLPNHLVIRYAGNTDDVDEVVK